MSIRTFVTGLGWAILAALSLGIILEPEYGCLIFSVMAFFLTMIDAILESRGRA